MKNCLIVFLMALVLYSCEQGPSQSDPKTIQKPVIAESDSVITLNSGGYNLSVQLPKAILKEETRFVYRPNFGDVELFVNPNFHAYISKDLVSLSSIKDELRNDGLFSRTFTEETKNEILYESSLPDGTSVGYSWIKRIETEGSPLIIKLDSQVKYTKQDIRKIQKIMNSIRVIQ